MGSTRDTRVERDADDFLAHYGIKGMKWGVRRSQGPGGTVRSRFGADKTDYSEDYANYDRLRKQTKKRGGTRTLSNQELQAVVTRMNLEQQYKNLNEKSMHRGEKTANDLLMTGAGLAASTALSIGATKISNPYVRTAAEHLGPVIIDGFTKSGGGKKKGK